MIIRTSLGGPALSAAVRPCADLTPLGAPAGPVETFIEVPFERPSGKCIPDGLIRVKRGPRRWTALVEAKTGVNVLNAAQLDATGPPPS